MARKVALPFKILNMHKFYKPFFIILSGFFFTIQFSVTGYCFDRQLSLERPDFAKPGLSANKTFCAVFSDQNRQKELSEISEQLIRQVSQTAGQIRVNWNEFSGSLHRIIAANLFLGAGSLDEDNIEDLSRRFIQQFSLLAVNQAQNLKLVHKEKTSNMWVISLQQCVEDIPVYLAFINLNILDDGRVLCIDSNYHPQINILPRPTISDVQAQEIAKNDCSFVQGLDRINQPELVILPVVASEGNHYEYHLCFKFNILQRSRFANWLYFVDAGSGEILFRLNQIDYGYPVWGNIQGRILPEYNLDPVKYQPFAHEWIKLERAYYGDDQHIFYTNTSGDYSGNVNYQSQYTLTTELKGMYFDINVEYQGGPDSSYSRSFQVGSGGAQANHTWADLYCRQTESNTYYHANRVRDYMRQFDLPSSLQQHMDTYQMPIYVDVISWAGWYANENAFYIRNDSVTGQEIIVMGNGGIHMRNLALFSDVVYHEYTHYITEHIYNPNGGEGRLPTTNGSESGAMREGFSDYFASSLNGDGMVGEGGLIKKNCEPEPEYSYWVEAMIRDISYDFRYPEDWWEPDPDNPDWNHWSVNHHNNKLFSGACWDLREFLGTGVADDLILRACSIGYPQNFADFVDSLLVADDAPGYYGGDGDITNGTPHSYEIYWAFGSLHGLGDVIPTLRYVSIYTPTAYHTIQEAVDAANDGDFIWIDRVEFIDGKVYPESVIINGKNLFVVGNYKAEWQIPSDTVIQPEPGQTGIKIRNANHVYLWNLQVDGALRGIDFYSEGSCNLKLENLVVSHCASAGVYIKVSGFLPNQPKKVLLKNLTVADNGPSGIRIDASSADQADFQIKNCSITDNSGYGIKIDSGPENSIDISYNDIWSNSSDGIYGPYSGSNNISQNPNYYNHINYIIYDNYSPCIDKGDPNDDYNRETNDYPHGTDYPYGRIDIGALGNTAYGRYNPGGSGGGGGGCFLADTSILMADGSLKPIQEVKIGDEVLALDEGTGQFRKDAITKTFRHRADKYLIINGYLKVTENHPVYSEGKWIEIGKLNIKDKLLNSKGKPEIITSIRKVNEKVSVYNLEVNPYHTYIAGGIVVHNKAQSQPPALR